MTRGCLRIVHNSGMRDFAEVRFYSPASFGVRLIIWSVSQIVWSIQVTTIQMSFVGRYRTYTMQTNYSTVTLRNRMTGIVLIETKVEKDR
jgi:hypothetical protein